MHKSIILIIALFLMSSCAGDLTLLDTSKHKTIEIKTTTGQELIDLQEALDSGAITEKEYARLKRKITKRLNESVDVNENY